MNRQIRKVAFASLILFGAIFINLIWIQLVDAQHLAEHPANTRLLLKEYSIERGPIVSADDEILVQSQQTPDEQLKYLRAYPGGPLWAHLTGYFSIRYGRAGLERSYNQALTGQGGVLTMQDLGDRLLGKGEKGDTLKLSIDSRLQQAAASALGNRKGAVVALDPLTGQILALVSFPSFDPGPLSQHSSKGQQDSWDSLNSDPEKPLLSRAVNETYPPGSTFKIITAASALEHGKGLSTSYPRARDYLPPQTDKRLSNFDNEICGGDMAEAFKISCNTYFAQLGAEIGGAALEETARKFGFGSVPPLDIRATQSRIAGSDKLKSPAFTAQSAIGQFEDAATPLQMALVASAVANGGKVPVPRLVKEIDDARGAKKSETEPEIWKEAISPETASTLRDLMISVVESGTGRAAQIPGVQVAGKTGTAQTGKGDGSVHAWFVCFAPAQNPRIALAVIVEASGNGNKETGGKVAAPVAKQVLMMDRSIAGW